MQRDDQDPYSDPSTVDPAIVNQKPLDPSDPNFNPNVNNPTTWDPAADRPSNEYAGWQWDPTMYRYVPGGAAASTPAPPPSGTDGGNGTGGTGGSNTGGSNTGATPPPSVAPPAQPSGGPFHPGTGSTEAEWAISQGLAGGPSAPAVGGGGGGAAPAQIPPSMAVSQPDTGQSAFGKSIRDALTKALGEPNVSMDDPTIAPAIAANRVASQRMLAQQRDAIAERLNAQGLGGSGALDAQMAQAFENSATQQGQFAGNAVLDQAKARRQELVNLMQTGAGILNADDAQAVQAKIADLDAYLRQQSVTNQNQQANDQMGLTGAYYQALLKQQQIRDLLGV